MKKERFICELKTLCIGDKIPDPVLVETGQFPSGWVSEYLNLLYENRLFWQNIDIWPKELCHCFYRVGFNIGYSYDEWRRYSKEPNVETEAQLAKIRMFTEAFIAGGPSLEWRLED